MRKRRLTHAATLLRTTKRSVLDIALESGFESQASFTRAFRAMFGAPPAAYRVGRTRPWYRGLEPATAASLDHLRDSMTHEPTIRLFERALAVRGFAAPIDLDDELPVMALWGRVHEELGPLAVGTSCYGVVLTSGAGVPHGPEHPIAYLAGVDATQMDVAAAPHAGAVPPGPYAVFEHRGPVTQIGATVDYAWGTWLPRSGRVKAARPDFERSVFGAAPFVVEILDRRGAVTRLREAPRELVHGAAAKERRPAAAAPCHRRGDTAARSEASTKAWYRSADQPCSCTRVR